MDPQKKPKDDHHALPLTVGGEKVMALDCEMLLGSDGPLPMTEVIHLRFADLTAALLAETGTTLILLPLIAPHYDAATAVERLQALGYAGKLTVLAPELPRPKLVERELRNLGPGTRLTLISP